MRSAAIWLVLSTGSGLLAVGACGSSDREGGFDESDSGSSSGGASIPTDGGIGKTDSGGPGFTGDPKTCEQAAQAASYVGCDYWPTVTFNSVTSTFDFAVVVSNAGDNTAHVTVTGPNNTSKSAAVEPGALATIKLPWVRNLKGPDNVGGNPKPITASVLEQAGAYHLVSDVPVVVYQFSPLQYEIDSDSFFGGKELSYTNDASLLLPSSAMTGNYRVMGMTGLANGGTFVAITATQDHTTVALKLGSAAKSLAGSGGITAANAGDTLNVTLNAGDVAQIQMAPGTSVDASGSLVQASAPVQVITGAQFMVIPSNVPFADHIEEALFPAETLGAHYLVVQPPGPNDDLVPHYVRLYGNVDGTTLTYKPSKPAACPDTLSAGQVADCGGQLETDFEVTGNHEFGVGQYLLGSALIDPDSDDVKGDPSQSFFVTVEQFRDRYVFLAPPDYSVNYVSITAPSGTTLTLDGSDKSSSLKPVAGTDWQQARIALGAGNGGGHTLETSAPVGLQVIGYGAQTSYQYPGGLNLGKIAPPPVN